MLSLPVGLVKSDSMMVYRRADLDSDSTRKAERNLRDLKGLLPYGLFLPFSFVVVKHLVFIDLVGSNHLLVSEELNFVNLIL